MAKLRVLVVEDSLTTRKALCEILAADPELEVVGEAEDGKRAIDLCQALRPDLVTMDMMLPVMSGLAATEFIMAHCPTPILVVSSSTHRGELFKTYEALAAGAVDVLEKPSGDEPDGSWELRFRAAVKLVARIRVIRHPRACLGALGRSTPTSAAIAERAPTGEETVVAVGASTGGPAALVEVLGALGPEFRWPLLLVLHINEPFGSSFADWLDGQTSRRVTLAQDGEPVSATAGRAVFAPPGRHLVVQAGQLRLTGDPERHSCRPSVDVLFESLAREYGSRATACLLTGMGRDGAAGMLAIRRAGGLTIAQDEATSIVFGMPGEAVRIGGASQTLPLAEIGPALNRLASGSRKGRP